MLKIHLQAVDSRYATADETTVAGIEANYLPPGRKLLAHQAHTIAALRGNDVRIIVNTAITGDGKTFAGQYPVLVLGWNGLTMYPTNELAADQQRSLTSLKANWSLRSVQRVQSYIITSAEIDRVEHEMNNQRAEALRNLLSLYQLVLTNPDIVHLATQFRYQRFGAARDMIPAHIINRYNLFTFDEFHVFSTPQVISVIITLLLLLEMTQDTGKEPRFLFLSATPQDMLTHLARLTDIPFTVIAGDYRHGLPTCPTDRRRILQPVTLYLYPRGDGLETWAETHLETIIQFFRDNHPARGVIIANSIATAYRVHNLLDQPCRQAGIELGEPNTGLTPIGERSINSQLFVATSTIDVGVDFKINFMVFESLDAATHIQRLGRLGRHETDLDGSQFEDYQAHALLPSWVIDSLKQDLMDEATIDREHYGTLLRNAYPPLQAFERYRQRWGHLQAVHVLSELGANEIRTQYAQTRERLKRRFGRLFTINVHRYLDLKKNQHAILNETVSFRGSSPFTALVINMSSRSQTVQAYNLIPLLLNAQLEYLPLDDAYHRAGANADVLSKHNPLAAYRLTGWGLSRPRCISVLLRVNTRDWGSERFETVIEQDSFHFRIEGPPIPDIGKLNRALEDRLLVALLVRNSRPDELRRRYRLGMQLELFDFQSVDGTAAGSVAFGRDSLLLDSVINTGKPRNPSDDPMFA